MSTTTERKAPTPAVHAERLLRDLASAYVGKPDKLEVHGSRIGTKILLTFQGTGEDHRHLVGSRGQHIWAVQQIFAAASRKAGLPIEVTLIDPRERYEGPPQIFAENPAWKPAPTMRLMKRVLDAVLPCEYAVRGIATGALYTLEVRPAQWSPAMVDLAKALHLIFHASGNQNGHRINVAMIHPETGEIVEWEPRHGPAAFA